MPRAWGHRVLRSWGLGPAWLCRCLLSRVGARRARKKHCARRLQASKRGNRLSRQLGRLRRRRWLLLRAALWSGLLCILGWRGLGGRAAWKILAPGLNGVQPGNAGPRPQPQPLLGTLRRLGKCERHVPRGVPSGPHLRRPDVRPARTCERSCGTTCRQPRASILGRSPNGHRLPAHLVRRTPQLPLPASDHGARPRSQLRSVGVAEMDAIVCLG